MVDVQWTERFSSAEQQMRFGTMASLSGSLGGRRYTAVNLLGSMQAAGNVGGAAIGRPNMTLFSPARLMNDCIHANKYGFGAVFAALWDAFFAESVSRRWGAGQLRRQGARAQRGAGEMGGGLSGTSVFCIQLPVFR